MRPAAGTARFAAAPSGQRLGGPHKSFRIGPSQPFQLAIFRGGLRPYARRRADPASGSRRSSPRSHSVAVSPSARWCTTTRNHIPRPWSTAGEPFPPSPDRRPPRRSAGSNVGPTRRPGPHLRSPDPHNILRGRRFPARSPRPPLADRVRRVRAAGAELRPRPPTPTYPPTPKAGNRRAGPVRADQQAPVRCSQP